MHVILPPDIEALAQQAAKQGGFSDISDFVVEAVRQRATEASIDAEQEFNGNTPAYDLPYEVWKERFDEFLANRKATNPHFDDSRESMYLDRL